MPYLHISDFKFGMDRRRPQAIGIPGTVYTLKNALISRGGDIVRAKKFASLHSLPSGTFGLAGLKGQLFTFGSAAEPSGMPLDVQYQRLQAPSTPTMERVLSAEAFDGKLYVIAEYDDGNVYHFYDGTRVSDWDTISDTNSSFNAVAERLARKIDVNSGVNAKAFSNVIQITAATAGTAFTATATASDVDSDSSAPTATRAAVTANVAAVTEVQATGTVTITDGSSDPTANKVSQITVNAVNLLTEEVPWVSSNDATANAVVNKINNNSATSGYTASAAGAVVTISAAPGTGATPNGYTVTPTTTGSVTATSTNMASGVAAVTAVAQVDKVTISGSSFDATDQWSVTVDGTTYKTTGRGAGAGTSAHVQKQRVWSPSTSLLQYCVLKDATDWSTASPAETAAGFINMSLETEGAQRLVGAAPYQGKTAIFARDNILIYQLETDVTAIIAGEPLENTGTMAERSIVPYGNIDVYYLDDTGIRSIQTRDGVDSPRIGDVGSIIDPFVQDLIKATDEDTLSRAVAVVERLDGRYMLAIDSTIVVLSRFPSSKITAWSYLEPGFSVEDLVVTEREVYARSGDTIYQYGGPDGTTYPDADELLAVVETPFMDAGDPGGVKPLEGFDAILSNVWHCEILVDPTDTTKTVDAGYIDETTFHKPSIKIPGYTSHVALRLTCSAAGDASVSSVAIHYDKGDAE